MLDMDSSDFKYVSEETQFRCATCCTHVNSVRDSLARIQRLGAHTVRLTGGYPDVLCPGSYAVIGIILDIAEA